MFAICTAPVVAASAAAATLAGQGTVAIAFIMAEAVFITVAAILNALAVSKPLRLLWSCVSASALNIPPATEV